MSEMTATSAPAMPAQSLATVLGGITERQQAATPSLDDERGTVGLGEIVAGPEGISLQVVFSRPAPSPQRLLGAQFAKAQEAWRSTAAEYAAFRTAAEAVSSTETELAAAREHADQPRQLWLTSLESGVDVAASEAAYIAAKAELSVADERLSVQRDILTRRREAAAQAWHAEFTELLRQTQQRIEADVAAIRAAIVRRLDGDALDLLREALACAVYIRLGASGLQGLVPPCEVSLMRVAIARLTYGHIGDSALGTWLARTAWTAARDPRIDQLDHIEVHLPDVATCRNRAVVLAAQLESAVLLMVDADTIPHADFLQRALASLTASSRPTAVLAPVLSEDGAPTVFDPTSEADVLRRLGRDEAVKMAGVRPIAAGGFACAAVGMDCFRQTPPPWFSWRWSDQRQHQFAVGEDVVASIQLRRAGCELVCDFDCWADHRKRVRLGKPAAVRP